MLGGIGWGELLIILVILLLIFGPSRLGDLGSALGKGIKGFRKSMSEPDEIDVTPKKKQNDELEGSDLEKAKGKTSDSKSNSEKN